jgi:glycerol-3-phosphate acyltransferase PlsY
VGSLIIVALLSYLIGSIPSSLWVGKIYKKIDLREHGSGNLGATNTFRILGWKAGVVVSLIDFFKGFVSVYYVSRIAFEIGNIPTVISVWETTIFVMIFAGLFAVIGHMFPIYANFKGGKGVLTACGMLYGIEPISISLAFSLFFIILFTTRYVSLASMLSTTSYPLFLILLRYGFGMDNIDGSLIVVSSIVVLIIIVKHKSNIERLLNGTESRITSFSPAKGRINENQ